ncbi:semaphorin-4B-like protein, partial [Lates japonicus]
MSRCGVVLCGDDGWRVSCLMRAVGGATTGMSEARCPGSGEREQNGDIDEHVTCRGWCVLRVMSTRVVVIHGAGEISALNQRGDLARPLITVVPRRGAVRTGNKRREPAVLSKYVFLKSTASAYPTLRVSPATWPDPNLSETTAGSPSVASVTRHPSPPGNSPPNLKPKRLAGESAPVLPPTIRRAIPLATSHFGSDAKERTTRSFSVGGVFNYTSLLLSKEDNKLYIGAREILFALNLSDISAVKLQRNLTWKTPERKRDECSFKGKDLQTDCFNYIKILLRMNSTHLYVCGTYAFSPICAYINTADFSLVKSDTGEIVTEDGRSRCPFNPEYKSTAIMADGELYAGTVSNFQGNEPIIYKSLSQGTALKTENSLNWLQDPAFVGSAYIQESLPKGNPVGDDDKIYFFFSEAGKEFDFFDNTIVSRIVRVCKGWGHGKDPRRQSLTPLAGSAALVPRSGAWTLVETPSWPLTVAGLKGVCRRPAARFEDEGVGIAVTASGCGPVRAISVDCGLVWYLAGELDQTEEEGLKKSSEGKLMFFCNGRSASLRKTVTVSGCEARPAGHVLNTGCTWSCLARLLNCQWEEGVSGGAVEAGPPQRHSPYTETRGTMLSSSHRCAEKKSESSSHWRRPRAGSPAGGTSEPERVVADLRRMRFTASGTILTLDRHADGCARTRVAAVYGLSMRMSGNKRN